jgi:SSS family solute:Na+ symporter
LLAGFLKILPMFLLVLPGVIGYVLFRDQIGSDANQTLPVLIKSLVPTGLRGLISAAVLAALMSAVSAALNSSGTLVAVDIVKRLRPSTADAALVRIGRISSVVVMILAILWSTQGSRFSSIFAAINIIAADLAPPITTVFLFGIFWRRGTSQASVVTLLSGLAMGVLAFLFDLPVIGHVRVLTDVWGISFLMQAWWMFCICSAIYVAVSLMTPAPSPEKIEGLTWSSPLAVLKQEPFGGPSDARLVAGVLLLTMCVLYVIFR